MSLGVKLLIFVTVVFFGILIAISYLIGQRSSQFGSPPSKKEQPTGPAPNGAQNDKVYFTSTADSKKWPAGIFVEKGSVPDLIELEQNIGQFKKGDILIYFVDFTTIQKQGSETLSMVSSSDGGKTWSKKYTVTLANKPSKGAPVDPSVVQLDDGTLRLYFFGSDITQGDPASAKGPHKVYSAKSNDAISFTAEQGVRFAAEKLTDPEVISYKDNWYMYYSLGQESGLAVSQDGLTFSAQPITGGEIGGVPGVVVVDGSVRLYGCGRGLGSAIAPDGIKFTKDTADVFGGALKGVVCDPAVVRSLSGMYLAVYKQKDL